MSEIPEHLRDFFVTEPQPPRRVNVNFFMDADVERAREHLSRSGSPLEYGKPMEDFHVFYPKDYALDGSFILGTPDSEIIQEPDHVEASKLLGVNPRSELHYGRCSVTEAKMQALRDVMDYIGRGKIFHHISVTSDDTGNPYYEIPFYMFIINDDSGNRVYGIGYAKDKTLTMVERMPVGLDRLIA